MSRYARHRQEVAQNSVITVNGDLRTLRRLLRIALEWGRPIAHQRFTNYLSQRPRPRDEL